MWGTSGEKNDTGGAGSQEDGTSLTWYEWVLRWGETLLPESIMGSVRQEAETTRYDWVVHLVLIAGIVIGVILIIAWKFFKKFRGRVDVSGLKDYINPNHRSQPRFRKRDRLAFIGRKAMRNARAVGSYIRGGQGKKRNAIRRFLRRTGLSGSPDSQSQTFRPSLPDEFLEEAPDDTKTSPFPDDMIIVLKNMRVFGHFEDPIFIDLYKNHSTAKVPQGQYLFKVGDPDDSMYIVQSGELNCYTSTTSPETVTLMKTVQRGEPIVSLLSFLDYLAGNKKVYKTVSAKAKQDSLVIKIPFEAFKNTFDKYENSLAHVVQVVMVRLQRVTLLALHQYLGLGMELLNARHRGITPVSSTNKEMAVKLEEPDVSCVKILEDMEDENCDASIAEQVFKNPEMVSQMNHDQLKRISRISFEDILGVSGLNKVRDEDIEIFEVSSGKTMIEEDTNTDNYLLIVLSGSFLISQKDVTDSKETKEIHRAYPGGLLGQLRVLTGEPSFYTITASERSMVAGLSSRIVSKIMSSYPRVSLRLAMSVIDHLSSYVRSMDFALEWTLVESGQALYKQGDVADCTYVVLSGRLRSVIKRKYSHKKEEVAEYGRGDLTGIVEALTESPRSTTVIAVRDTEVAKLPAGLINYMKHTHTKVLLRLITLLGSKLQRIWEVGSPVSASPMSGLPMTSTEMSLSSQTRFSTVAVIPVTDKVPLSAFTFELLHALSAIGPSLRLTLPYVKAELGEDALEKSRDFRLSGWLAKQEDQHRIIVYQCGVETTPEMISWTQLCIRHADVIFLLAMADEKPKVTAMEEQLVDMSKRTRKEMVFLHKEDTVYPTGTAKWLAVRNWVNAHYHIKCPRRLFFNRKHEDKIEKMYKRILEEHPMPDIHSDFSRLSRMLTGTSVGLVLGGGGARGCSHVGMIKATLEAGIPIDRVAGVSIGSFIGGLYCQERDMAKLTIKARTFSFNMTKVWRQIFDLTYPYTSMFSGRAFNSLIEEAFGNERNIEDLWLPYFTITTDITDSAMRIHDSGCLWRYVRSSMTLAGYLPPLCDPMDGHLLVDGGYVNNLPADIMRHRGAKHILAIDVGGQDDNQLTNYGDALSGWSVLWHRWNPFTSSIKVPDQADVQTRLAYVSCVRQLVVVKNADFCDYIRPPIDKYKTLQFGSFDEIRDVGYYHGKTYFMGMKKAGQMQQFYWMNPNKQRENLPGVLRRGSLENISTSPPTNLANMLESISSSPPNHFTNLAEMVCRIKQATPDKNSIPVMMTDEHEMSEETRYSRYSNLTSPEFEEDLTDEDSENLLSDEENDNPNIIGQI